MATANSLRVVRSGWGQSRAIRATWLGLLGIVLAAAGGTSVQGQNPPRQGHSTGPGGSVAGVVGTGSPTGELASILARCSAAWSSDGLIRRERLEELAADPRIRGDQAVALATLIHHFGKEMPDSFRADEFDALPDRKSLDRTYRAMAAKVTQVRLALFTEGRPNFGRLKQGPVGACYFISGAGWMAHYHPDRIVRMIRPLPGGAFEVTFPSGERATVDPLTETEVLVNAAGGTLADGLWVVVLEKALGMIQGEHSQRRAAIADPILRINGGSSRANIKLWTGHPVETLRFDHPDEVKKLADSLRAMQEQRLMAEASIGRNHAPSALPHGHSYAVMAFDPSRNLVTLWNPWGDDFTPKGPSGPEHGWPRRHGIFEVSLHDFVRTFSSISIEQRP